MSSPTSVKITFGHFASSAFSNRCNFAFCHLLKFILGLFKLQELVKTPSTARTEMYIRQAGPESYRQVLKEIRQKEIYKLIVDTNPKHIHQFFRAVCNILFCYTERPIVCYLVFVFVEFYMQLSQFTNTPHLSTFLLKQIIVTCYQFIFLIN